MRLGLLRVQRLPAAPTPAQPTPAFPAAPGPTIPQPSAPLPTTTVPSAPLPTHATVPPAAQPPTPVTPTPVPPAAVPTATVPTPAVPAAAVPTTPATLSAGAGPELHGTPGRLRGQHHLHPGHCRRAVRVQGHHRGGVRGRLLLRQVRWGAPAWPARCARPIARPLEPPHGPLVRVPLTCSYYYGSNSTAFFTGACHSGYCLRWVPRGAWPALARRPPSIQPG